MLTELDPAAYFSEPHYWLLQAQVPTPLMAQTGKRRQQWSSQDEDFVTVDLEICDGVITSVAAAGTLQDYGAPAYNLAGSLVWPCFVDLHTHLDKGHIWERTPNPNGTFEAAIAAVQSDAAAHWSAEDIYHRMNFGLRCSYAHGTKAIRTHLDASGQQGVVAFEVFRQLQREWGDRLILQPVCLVPLDYFLTPEAEDLADRVAEAGGVLGGVSYMNPDLDAQIERTFALAKDRQLALDFHVDENGDPNSVVLDHVAAMAIRYHYQGKVVCGHCCSLALRQPYQISQTITQLKKAGITIVSLPLCNLYLQDRNSGLTPRWRGVTALHELKKAGIPIALSSDNCRDPFYGYGDHDVLEVFSQSVKIAQLDRPFGSWCKAVTSTPADVMGLPEVGRIGVGLPADLVIFRARRYSELLSRPQGDRLVLRQGKAIDTTLPDYAELDPVLGREFTIRSMNR